MKTEMIEIVLRDNLWFVHIYEVFLYVIRIPRIGGWRVL